MGTRQYYIKCLSCCIAFLIGGFGSLLAQNKEVIFSFGAGIENTFHYFDYSNYSNYYSPYRFDQSRTNGIRVPGHFEVSTKKFDFNLSIGYYQLAVENTGQKHTTWYENHLPSDVHWGGRSEYELDYACTIQGYFFQIGFSPRINLFRGKTVSMEWLPRFAMGKDYTDGQSLIRDAETRYSQTSYSDPDTSYTTYSGPNQTHYNVHYTQQIPNINFELSSNFRLNVNRSSFSLNMGVRYYKWEYFSVEEIVLENRIFYCGGNLFYNLRRKQK